MYNWTGTFLSELNRKCVWQVVIYFYAKAMSVGDTVVVIRNASVLPHSCPVQSIGTVNTIGLIADVKTSFIKCFVMY